MLLHDRLAVGYQDHYLVDGGKARIILSLLVAPADVTEDAVLADLLWRSRFRWKLWPRRVIGDAKYGPSANIRLLEEAGIQAFFPLTDHRQQRTGFFGQAQFSYDAERDVYHCPQGTALRPQGHNHQTDTIRYQAPATACRACPVRAQCTDSPDGRSVSRQQAEPLRERVRGYAETEPFKRALRKRAVWVEPLFGEAKQWHGLRQFRLRTLPKVNGEALLVAAGQNLKHLLTARGWGRRPFPDGSALARRTPAHSGTASGWLRS